MKNGKLWGAVALAAISSAFGASQANAQATVSWSGAPRTQEEDRQFRINGRVMYDFYDVDVDFAGTASDQSYSRSATRRAFLGVEGRFTNEWRYNIKYAFVPGASDSSGPSGSGGDDTGFDDAFIEYAGSNFSIFIGQNNAVSPLEDRTSSLYIPFNERSGYINAFGYAKTMGVDILFNGGNWSLGAGFHGDDLNNPETTNQDELTEVRVRGTWAPVYLRDPDGVRLLHLGLSARYRDNGGGATNVGSGLRYRARPSNGFGDRFVDTQAFAQQDLAWGAEIAGQYNQFGFTAEYGHLTASPTSEAVTASTVSADRGFSGGYVDLFWSPTGESRNYNAADGSFGRVTPRRTLGSDGGIGHVMLGLRYEWLNLRDGVDGGPAGATTTTNFTSTGASRATVDGGEQSGWTVGAEWEPISYIRFRLNYSDLDIDRPGNTTLATGQQSGDAQVVTLRTQIDW